MFKLISTALVGATLLAATPALAQNDPVSMTVRTADLDLANPGDRARLDRRIRSVAGQICDNGVKSIELRTMYQSCRSAVLASANQQLAARSNAGEIQLARAR